MVTRRSLRGWLPLACGALVFVFAVHTAWRVLTPAERPPPVWTPRAHLSDEFNASMMTLSAIAGRERISDADAEFLLSIMDWKIERLPSQLDDATLTPDQEEAMWAIGDGYAIAGERLRFGGVTAESRERLAARVVAGLDSDNPHERLLSIAMVCYGRLVAEDTVRRRVLELQSDQDEAVRSQAIRQLAHYDKIASLEQTGRWKETSRKH